MRKAKAPEHRHLDACPRCGTPTFEEAGVHWCAACLWLKAKQ